MTEEKQSHVGDLVRFHCQSGYMMVGHPLASCKPSGEWSRPAPQCVRACTYPGALIAGTISNVKFYYAVGETVNFDCSKGWLVLAKEKARCELIQFLSLSLSYLQEWM